MKSIMKIWHPIGAALLFFLQPLEACYPIGEILIESTSLSHDPGSKEHPFNQGVKRDEIPIKGDPTGRTTPVDVLVSRWEVHLREIDGAKVARIFSRFRLQSHDDPKSLDWTFWTDSVRTDKVGVHYDMESKRCWVSVLVNATVLIYEPSSPEEPEEALQDYLRIRQGKVEETDFRTSLDLQDVFDLKQLQRIPQIPYNALGLPIEVDDVRFENGHFVVRVLYYDDDHEPAFAEVHQQEDGSWRKVEVRQ